MNSKVVVVELMSKDPHILEIFQGEDSFQISFKSEEDKSDRKIILESLLAKSSALLQISESSHCILKCESIVPNRYVVVGENSPV